MAACRLLRRLIEVGAVTVDDQPKAAIEASQIEEAADQAEEGLIKIIFDRPEVVVEGAQGDEANGGDSGVTGSSEEHHSLKSGPEKGAETDGGRRR
jgi:hypothetical protein